MIGEVVKFFIILPLRTKKKNKKKDDDDVLTAPAYSLPTAVSQSLSQKPSTSAGTSQVQIFF